MKTPLSTTDFVLARSLDLVKVQAIKRMHSDSVVALERQIQTENELEIRRLAKNCCSLLNFYCHRSIILIINSFLLLLTTTRVHIQYLRSSIHRYFSSLTDQTMCTSLSLTFSCECELCWIFIAIVLLIMIMLIMIYKSIFVQWKLLPLYLE
jgi:hypothetical protein